MTFLELTFDLNILIRGSSLALLVHLAHSSQSLLRLDQVAAQREHLSQLGEDAAEVDEDTAPDPSGEKSLELFEPLDDRVLDVDQV